MEADIEGLGNEWGSDVSAFSEIPKEPIKKKTLIKTKWGRAVDTVEGEVRGKQQACPNLLFQLSNRILNIFPYATNSNFVGEDNPNLKCLNVALPLGVPCGPILSSERSAEIQGKT